MKGRTEWGDVVPVLVRQRTMGFVVGNGLSRLCGAPSWGDLFGSPDVAEVFEREGISQGAPYLELAYLLSKRAPVLWDRVLRRLYDWAQGSAGNESHVHRALLEVLKPGKPSPPHVSILTTNVDPLLENYGYRRDHIGYLHGEPNNHDTWVFTADEYWDSWNNERGIRQVFSRLRADGVLFIGYGHSHEDVDVVQNVIELRKRYFGKMFTLIARQEAQRGESAAALTGKG